MFSNLFSLLSSMLSSLRTHEDYMGEEVRWALRMGADRICMCTEGLWRHTWSLPLRSILPGRGGGLFVGSL